MQVNRSTPGDRKRKLGMILLAIGLVTCLGIGSAIFIWADVYIRTVQRAKEAEKILTLAHRDEVVNAIEKFEIVWQSLDAYHNPPIQAVVATQEYVQAHGLEREDSHFKFGDWYVTKAAKVGETRVLEYSAERFKAIACIKRIIVTVSPDERVLEAESTLFTRILYVFVREDSEWKIATLYDVYLDDWAYRDWRNATEEQKTYIGELPESLVQPVCHPS